jgi:hypothetical protein
MTDKARPGVRIMLDRERILSLDLNAMIAFEEATGKSFLAGEVDVENIGQKELRPLIWACLLSDDPELTQREVGVWINLANAGTLIRAFRESLRLSLPGKEAVERRPLAVSPPPGSSYGWRGVITWLFRKRSSGA